MFLSLYNLTLYLMGKTTTTEAPLIGGREAAAGAAAVAAIAAVAAPAPPAAVPGAAPMGVPAPGTAAGGLAPVGTSAAVGAGVGLVPLGLTAVAVFPPGFFGPQQVPATSVIFSEAPTVIRYILKASI